MNATDLIATAVLISAVTGAVLYFLLRYLFTGGED
jgi:hypothetical protein